MSNQQHKNYPNLPENLNIYDLDDNNSLKKMVIFIGKNKTVIDFGCASGYLANFLKKQGCRVTGLEINPEAAEIAKQYCEEVFVCDLDFDSLNDILGDRKFDVAVFGDVLEHLRNPWKVLEQTKDFLNPSGYVIASIPNIAHGAIRLSLLEGNFDYMPSGILDDTHLRFFTRKTVEELFEKTGYFIHQIDYTKLPIFDQNPLIPCVKKENFAIELINIFKEDKNIDILQFVIKAFPSNFDNKYFSLKENNEIVVKKLQETQLQLQETQLQLQETQLQLQEKQSQLQETQSQLQEKQSQLQETQSQLQKAQSEVFIAKETISSMETSKFWKLRKLWFRIKKNNYFSIQKHKNIEIIDNNEFIGNELTSSINIKKTTKKVMLLLWPFIAVGGAETLTLNLLKSSVVKEQFDYVNICLIQQPENLGDLSQEFEKVSCAFYRGSNFSDDNVLGIFHKLRYLINQYQADVLFISNGSTIFYDLVVQIKSEFPKLRIVNQVYDHQQGWINHYTNNIARSVDYHIAPNQDIKNAYIKYGVSDHNSPIIYHGVDMLEYQENLGNKEEVNLIKKTLNLPIDKIIVTFAARLHPQKRPLDFIQIANYFKNDPRFHFLIVGNGNLFTDVKNNINQLNLLNITQHEFQEDIKNIYLCSDILVVNSEYEGLPIVLLQSLAMNIPVISTAVGGIPDVIKDNYNGILVKKSGDINSFTKGLLKIANNLDDFKQNSREHRKFLEANYSLEIMAQKYLQVFNGEL